MAKIQRYQRGKFAGLDIPQTDFASLKQAQTTYGAVGEMFGQMADFVNKKAEQQAIQRGTRRVSDFGAQETLRQIAQQGGPTNVEERQAYEFANKIAVADLEANAINEMNTLMEQARVDKLPVNEFKLETEAIVNGFSDAAEELLDPELSVLLRQKLLSHGLDKLNSHNNFIHDLQLADLRIARENTGKTFLNEALMQSYSTGMFDKDGLQQKLVDAGFSELEAQSEIISIEPAIEKNIFLHEYEKLPTYEEKRKFLETRGNQFEKLLPEKQRTVVGKLTRELDQVAKEKQNELNAELKQQQATYVNTLTNDYERALKYGVPMREYSNEEIDRIYANNPEQAEIQKKQLSTIKQIVNETRTLNSLTNEELQKVKNDALADYKTIEPDDPMFDIIKSRKEILPATIDNLISLRIKNPVEAAFQGSPALKDIFNSSVQQVLNGEQPQGALISYVGSLDLYYDTIDVPQSQRKYLETNQAVTLANQLNGLGKQSLDASPIILRTLVNSFGDKSELILKEIKSNGLNPSFYHAMRYMDGDEEEFMFATRIMQTSQIENLSDETKNLPDVTNYKTAVNSLISEAQDWNIAYSYGDRSGESTKIANEQYDIVRKMMVQLIRSGVTPSDAKEYIKKNFYAEDAINTDHVVALAPTDKGSRYEDVLMDVLKNGLQDVGIPIPETKLAPYRQALDQRLRLNPTIEVPDSESVNRAAELLWYRDLRSNSRWINNETGDGYFLVRGETNQKVFKADGSVVEIKYDDIETYTEKVAEFEEQMPWFTKLFPIYEFGMDGEMVVPNPDLSQRQQ